jgi:hypothetical protein
MSWADQKKNEQAREKPQPHQQSLCVIDNRRYPGKLAITGLPQLSTVAKH